MFKHKLIRKIDIVSAIVAIGIIAGVLVGCQKEDEVEFPDSMDLETQILINTIFDKANLNSVIYATNSSGITTIKIDPVKNIISRLKSGSESSYQKPDSTWTKWGAVTGVPSATRMYSSMKETYKDDCYELKIEPARDNAGNLIVDKKGNPTGDKDVYHRPCR